MKTYLWIEDRKDKSGYQFWKIFMEQLCPQIIVESKKNNSELVKAVNELKDTKNKYIIVFDNAFDNSQIILEQKRIIEYVKNKENVVLMDIICFEYVLLEFKHLIEWIYALDDEFLIKRKEVILAREKLINAIQGDKTSYKDISEIREYCKKLDSYNVEKLSARILFDLTRNTGFEVSKGKLGVCWTKSCCEWKDRKSNDVCGLDKDRLHIKEKMKQIYEGTSLIKEFKNVGLEMIV